VWVCPFFFDKKKYININIIKRKIGANRHLTKGYKSSAISGPFSSIE